MVSPVDRSKFRISQDPFSNVGIDVMPLLEDLVLAVHVAEDETRFIQGVEGYDVRIDLATDYDGPGTLYLVDVLKGQNVYGSVGIGISKAA